MEVKELISVSSDPTGEVSLCFQLEVDALSCLGGSATRGD